MDVSTQIDAPNLSSQPTAPAMGQAIPQNHFSLMVGQLRAHSLHPDYLPHSTTIPIPHSTSPTPPARPVKLVTLLPTLDPPPPAPIHKTET